MERTDYLLKNLLLDVMQGLGTRFENKETGENENSEILKDLLKDERVKNNLYRVLEDELIKALEEKYPELKGTF